jgi:hypothetical protein
MGDTYDQLAQAGLGIATGQVAGAMNDYRQMNQQAQLNKQQTAFNMNMMNYQAEKQYEMWQKTGPVGMVEQYKKAGLNPALMYGLSGGGGGTTGNISQGQSAPEAPKGGGEYMAGMAMMQQAQVQAAQVKEIQSQADLNAAQAENLRKGTTPKAIAETENLMQGLDNMKQEYEYKKLEITEKNLQNYALQGTLDEQMQSIRWNAQQALTMLKMMNNDKKISDATMQDKITQWHNLAVQSALEVTLKQAQISLTTEQTKQLANSIGQQWAHLNNEQAQIEINRQLATWQTSGAKFSIEQITRLMGIAAMAAY